MVRTSRPNNSCESPTTMRHSFPVNVTLILRVSSTRDAQDPLITETDQHEISRLLRYRLAVLEAALRRVEEMQRKAAKAFVISPCNPAII